MASWWNKSTFNKETLMRKLLFAILVSFSAVVPATAQTDTPAVSGHPFFDYFVGPDGSVIYPQYVFKVDTSKVVVTGYGFYEGAPNEPWFSNHVNTFTWTRAPQLSLRTEVGGRVLDFTVHTPAGNVNVPPAAFFQIGPQVNVHRVFHLKGADYLVVSYLPHLAGIRPDNWILAGGTKPIPLGKSMTFSIEGYRRFFSDGGPDYSEYWFLANHTRLKHVSLGAFLLQDGEVKSFAFGGRISP